MSAHENAKRIGKKDSGGLCIFRATAPVDAAHIFSAGEYPSLADYFSNIVAVSRDIHSSSDKACLDFKWVNGVRMVRPVAERLWMVQELSLDEFRPMIFEKLHTLENLCEKHKIFFPTPEKPSDYYSLIRGLR